MVATSISNENILLQQKSWDIDMRIPDDIFNGVRDLPDAEFDKIETCKDMDTFKGIFRHAQKSKYEVVIKNDPMREQYGFVVNIPMFFTVDKIWYKVDVHEVYNKFKFGYMI